MQDVQEAPKSRPVVAVAIGVPFLLFAGYVAYLVIPVIASAVMVAIVRTVTGA
ncbi:hypothetical protein [Granulicella sp. L46]|jgi:hypothetical protein|uniref:hypothetical protein n=1 Tax=Granulicella sp. L46 TaxID=1641865 RepID=UPI00131B45FE|nr:hypothetical protein [Granulicella sp. L46]